MTTTTILSDNGVSSGTAGIKTTGGNDGTLQLQTTTTGGTATTAVTIDTSQNVGIGTSPSAWGLSPALDLGSGGLGMYSAGIQQNAYYNGSNWVYKTSNTATQYLMSGGLHRWGYAASGTAGATFSFTEAMRIDTSGNLLVGTTTAPTNGAVLSVRNSAATAGKKWNYGPNTSNNFTVYNQSDVGVYIVDGATSWTATSDERLKTALVPFANAAAKVAALRAGTGRYLTDEESVSRSFLIAQDVQAVLPEAVDAQDDDQETLGLRYTDVIPLLVAAIQEQQAIIEQLRADVAQLKGAQA